MSVGQRIKELREQVGLSQQELALRAGVTRSLVYKIEEGSANNPTLDKLRKIAAALNGSVAYIIGEGHPISDSLRKLALRDNIVYKELDTLILMNFEGKQLTTVEEWDHLLRSAKKFPKLYKRLGKVSEQQAADDEERS